MCGIVGFINCGDQDTLKNAVRVIGHRGPDGSGQQWFASTNSGLGHTRLAIIDLSPSGEQPMYNATNKSWITFNGEIYNYKDIRKELIALGHKFETGTDTEVIAIAYHQWKEKCLEKFNGMFAFCIYNQDSGDTFIARDRLGIKPLYYWNTFNKLAFSSEIKALLELKEYNKQPDLMALQTPVHFQIKPFTAFKDIYKLEPGCYLKFNKNEGILIKEYWNLDVKEYYMNEKEVIEELDWLITDAVNLNMISDIPVGAMLSGGLDSSLLCVLMQKKMSSPLNTFTIKFDKKDLKHQGNSDDSYYAQLVADKFNFNHTSITITPDITDLFFKMVYHMDEPLADPSAINTYLIAENSRKNGINVLLSGMGADEVFGGYRSYIACMKTDSYQNFIPPVMRKAISSLSAKLPESNSRRNYRYLRWYKRFIEISNLNSFERQIVIKNAGLRRDHFSNYYVNPVNYSHSYYYQLENAAFYKATGSYLTKMCYCDTMNYMTDHNLNYSDKAMMAAGVEGRPTLIDHRIVELMFKQVPSNRIRGNTQKYLLKKVAEKYLPKEIIYRSKAPFSAPIRGWLKNELSEMVSDILSAESIKKRGLYNTNYVQKLIENNKSGLEDNSQLIWRLMVNETWFRTFFN